MILIQYEDPGNVVVVICFSAFCCVDNQMISLAHISKKELSVVENNEAKSDTQLRALYHIAHQFQKCHWLRKCLMSVTTRFEPNVIYTDSKQIPADLNDGVGAGDGKIDCDAEDCPVRNVVEKYLLERVKKSTKRRKNKKKNESDDDEDNEGSKRRLISRIFQLAQFYFEERKYKKAFEYYDKIKDEDDQALFQIGVMTYDGVSINMRERERVSRKWESLFSCGHATL